MFAHCLHGGAFAESPAGGPRRNLRPPRALDRRGDPLALTAGCLTDAGPIRSWWAPASRSLPGQLVTRWVTMVPLRDRQMTIYLRVRRKTYRLGVFHSLVILFQLSRSLALWGDARVASIWRFGGDRAAARRAQVAAGGGWTKTSTVFSRRWRLTTLPSGSHSPKPSSACLTGIWRASSIPGGRH